MKTARRNTFRERRNAATKGRKSSGFTLIEAMIVVTLVGALASMGISDYNLAVRRSQMGSTQKRMSSMIRGARLHAVYAGEPVMHSIVGNTYDYYGRYFITATVKDLNGDGKIIWTLSNDTDGDRRPSSGEGELVEVLEVFSIDSMATLGNYNFYGWSYAGYDSGCFVVATNARCFTINGVNTYTQALFLPNGRQYSMASMLPAPNTLDIPVRTGYMVYDSGQPLRVGDTLTYVQVGETGTVVEF